jgi:hypothetical protein
MIIGSQAVPEQTADATGLLPSRPRLIISISSVAAGRTSPLGGQDAHGAGGNQVSR